MKQAHQPVQRPVRVSKADCEDAYEDLQGDDRPDGGRAPSESDAHEDRRGNLRTSVHNPHKLSQYSQLYFTQIYFESKITVAQGLLGELGWI